MYYWPETPCSSSAYNNKNLLGNLYAEMRFWGSWIGSFQVPHRRQRQAPQQSLSESRNDYVSLYVEQNINFKAAPKYIQGGQKCQYFIILRAKYQLSGGTTRWPRSLGGVWAFGAPMGLFFGPCKNMFRIHSAYFPHTIRIQIALILSLCIWAQFGQELGGV